MSITKEKYKTDAIPALKEKFQYSHDLKVPKIEKVTINVGISSKADPRMKEVVLETLRRISGQAPVETKARKSEAGFKIRTGMVIGAMVTLRGNRMWDFIDKMVNVSFPRIRDFRGISEKSVDKTGNFNFGFKEHIAFPEISANEVEFIHGLQVNIKTTAYTHEEGLELFKSLGFPFKK
ncbi:50S ribosomal protein L5 [Candidatus Parcubacteria bacterium]|nr:MAG: 50S ribosomal protein L5 [Candidatus Parcubacteria bacterium]